MSDCMNCNRVEPIQDTGYVWLRPSAAFALNKMEQLGASHDFCAHSGSKAYYLHYEHKETLLDVFATLRRICTPEDIKEVSMLLTTSPDLEPPQTGWLHMDTYFSRMQHHDLVSIIQAKRFASYMQPIAATESNTVYGYEFLLRPAPDGQAFQPYQLFQVAQETGLHSFLDRAARISAIETSHAHLPKGLKRFINFLPSSIYNPNYCLSHTFEAIQRFDLDPADFVFEVVETEHIASVNHLRSIFEVYKRAGIQVALDDVGAGYSTIDVLNELKPDFVKIDRDLIDGCDLDLSKQHKIKQIVKASSAFGAKVLAEGMERKEEWEFCKMAGIPLAQGYLIGKPSAEKLQSDVIVIA
ncbi:EAL domain-containing protein [Paenibacillus hexagrammi]|uniref:EAL domain-containing protein n=1 Tax=Paenibacillus hexagrammi TaxID=2908839 RepID=A0ABY3SG76_9BACL|nr:EAL domain-containing protein [Paenibacillus sp. YPD9-1]UJF32458.1 EAL domain-containing protein [Paenibacillus sp. YPD9-1]